MKAFVLDASFTIEWFSSGASSADLKKPGLLDDRVAVVPHLLRNEVMNVLATWRRRGDIGNVQRTRILNNVFKLPFAVVDDGNPEAIVTKCIRTTMFHAGPFRTIADVEWATAGWVDWWNNRRLHSSLAYRAPEDFEHAHYAALNRELQPV